MGQARLQQPDLLPPRRQGWPLRGVGAPGVVRRRSCARRLLHSERCEERHTRRQLIPEVFLMKPNSMLLIGTADLDRCTERRLGHLRSGRRAEQVQRGGTWRARVLRIQGLRDVADHLAQSDREGGRCDPRQPLDDRRLPGRHSRQRQACTGWRQDGQDSLAAETEPVFSDCDSSGRTRERGLHGEGQQERFADSGGWGYAVFDYNAASDTFTPGTTAGTPPQGNDAKCGFACHTAAKTRDYVFTEYGKR